MTRLYKMFNDGQESGSPRCLTHQTYIFSLNELVVLKCCRSLKCISHCFLNLSHPLSALNGKLPLTPVVWTRPELQGYFQSCIIRVLQFWSIQTSFLCFHREQAGDQLCGYVCPSTIHLSLVYFFFLIAVC